MYVVKHVDGLTIVKQTTKYSAYHCFLQCNLRGPGRGNKKVLRQAGFDDGLICVDGNPSVNQHVGTATFRTIGPMHNYRNK